MGKLAPKDIENILSLTPLQEGMLFHYLQNPQSPFYFEQLSLEISGVIDHKLFEEAWNVVIKTNEMLRVVFRWDKVDKPVQIVLKEHKFQPRYIDISDTDTGERKQRLEQIKRKDGQEKFDLQEVPFRVTLCKIEGDKYVMILSNHHILYDGWSNGIILKEFFTIYHALSKGELIPPFPVKPSFKEFVRWVQNQDRNKLEQFWRNYLADFETPTELSIKKKVAEVATAAGAADVGDYALVLDEDTGIRLDGFVKGNRLTPASVFYTSWGLLLQRYNGSEDVVFGSTVSGRSADIKSIEEMVGLFINTIPLRVQASANEKIIDAVIEIDQQLRDRASFESTPLVDIAGYTDLDAGSTLFDTIVAIENYPLDNRLAPDGCPLSITSYAMSESTHYDLSVGIAPFKGANKIEINFNYKKARLERDAVVHLAEHFKGLLQSIIEKPEAVLSQLEIISLEEKNRILHEFNNTAVEYPRDKTIHQLFEEQAAKTPDRVGLVGPVGHVGQVGLSYKKLNEQSDRLAGLLIEKGVLPDTIVGIMVERSVEMIIGIFGILKAGGAYMPIDPDYPQERIDYMLKDSGAKLLVTANDKEGEKVRRWDGEKNREIIFLDSLSSSCLTSYLPNFLTSHPFNLTYIIYTSGSTGKPKGVLIDHFSVVSLVSFMMKRLKVDNRDRTLLILSICFDASVGQIFLTLASGSALVLINKETLLNNRYFEEYMISQSITQTAAVPSFFSNLDINKFPGIKRIISGGEACPVPLARKLSDYCDYYNQYGPTETTVTAVEMKVENVAETSTNIPIGKPIANAVVYVLDRFKHPAPIGAMGEMYVGGNGVARGYLNNPELTDKKFIYLVHRLDGLHGNENKITKLYRSGDLGRWMRDGNIEFLGRVDHQVKIRGYRIEPMEIENLLLTHPNVKESMVTPRKYNNGENYLCAYVVFYTPQPPGLLRKYLSAKLPDYMVPAYFVMLEKMPLNSNGKVAVNALPEPERTGSEKGYTGPRIEVERKLAELWSHLLGINKERIGIDDNFFRLGGHSLKATAMISKIHKELGVRVEYAEVFQNPTIRHIAGHIKNLEKEAFQSIDPVEKKEYYSLSSPQERIFIVQEVSPESAAYNMTGVYRLEGKVEKEKIEIAIKCLIKRHEMLRASFRLIGGSPAQRIHDHVEFEMEVFGYRDWVSGFSEEKKITKVFGPTFFQKGGPPEAIIKSFVRPFDLSKAPLLRAGLIKLADEKHILIVDMHHIIADGISSVVFMKEFMAITNGEELPPLMVHYTDYAEWRGSEKQIEAVKKQENYWLRQFGGEIPVLDLAPDYIRPAAQSHEGDVVNFEFGSEEVQALKTLALKENATFFMALISIFYVFLSKFSGQEDIIVGTPAGGRLHNDLQDVVGMFVNTLALRNFPSGEKTYRRFLGEVRNQTMDAFTNQDYPFEELVERAAPARDRARNPLFDAMFTFQNMDFPGLEIPGLKIMPYGEIGHLRRTSKFDITLTGMEDGEKLGLTFEYRAKLFCKETIGRHAGRFKQTAYSILENPQKKIAVIEIIPDEEKRQILDDFNDTGAGFPRAKTIHGLFEEQVEKAPDHIAVVGPPISSLHSIQMSYNDLNEKSNRLAHILSVKGVHPGSIVGVMAGRAVEAIPGLLGILKSGGAYLPIDPEYPQERIQYMLRDSKAKIIIDYEFLMNAPQAPPHHSSFIIHHSNRLAYIIYTSGTTGKPKGALLEHKNVVRLLFNDKFQFDFKETDVWTLFHSLAFDFSVWEMYGTLLYGGKLVVVPKMTARDPRLFLDVLINHNVTVLNQTPSAFYNLLHEELKTGEKNLSVRYIIFGGEALKPGKLKEWRRKYPCVKLVNMFGITETTVHVTYKEIGELEIEEDICNIGKPIPTSSVYILDRYKQLTPVGAPGELYVGGEGAAVGYLNHPELTAERFMENPYKKGDRIYRSGDLARISAEGEMMYLGRLDHQVQLRGFRIELGEIENCLLTYQSIKDAVVIDCVTATGDSYLCAYIIPKSSISAGEFEPSSMREFLSGRLPDYMIPSYFVTLPEIPLTPNGKIDRKRLPQPGVKSEKKYKPPSNKTEEELAKIWQEVLELERVGIEDNFFNAGGDSIKAIRLISAINNRLNSNLKIVDLYTHVTIGELTVLIHREESGYITALYRKVISDFENLKYRSLNQIRQHDPSTADQIENIYPMSDIEKGMVFYYMKHAGRGIYHDQFVYPMYYKDFDGAVFKQALILMAMKHEILRTGFNIEEFEEPAHVVYKEPKLNFVITDLSGLTPDRRREQIRLFIEEDRRNPFEILNPPLWRMHIFTLGNDRVYLVLIFHHAILDGWSAATLMTELHAAYNELKRTPSYVPPGLQSSYKDMVIQERVEKENERTPRYWKEELEDYIRLDFSETTKNKDELAPMKVYELNAGAEILERARQAAARCNTHVKNLCFSAYAYMMGMFSHEKDIVVGCVTNNRTGGPDGDKVLGCFLNTAPVRLRIPGDITWKEYIVWVEGKMLEVKKYERLSLFEIALLIGEKNKDRNPLFDTLFNFTDFHVYRRARIDESSGGIAIDSDYSPAVEGRQDTNTLFDFEVDITMGNLLIHPKYNAASISDEMVKKCCTYFLNILDKYINDPDSPARRDDILPSEEKEKLLYLFNDTKAPYSREKTMNMLFEERVEISPDNIAVVGPSITEEAKYSQSVQITYRELNSLSNRLAYGLRKMGVGAGDFVGVIMERSVEMVPAVMGILKAGGAYAPLEPYLPERRIEKILESLKTKCVLADPSTRPGLEAMEASLECLNHIVSLDKKGFGEFKDNPAQNPATMSGSEAISYVIFTSGSTGTPKGVVETHRPVVNVIEWVNKTFEVGEKDKLLFVASLGFDLSVYDIFGVLASGASIRTAGSGDMKEPSKLLEIMVKEGVTFWDSAPAALQQLLPFFSEVREAGKITGLRLVFLSGDWIPVSMPGALRDTFKGVRVISLGGATEATIWSNYYPVGDVDPAWPSIPYGKPIQNAKYYIMDTSLNLCPINIAGDLYIGGECLASEYKNDPALTAAKFIDNPFCPGERLYKTGDIARWFEDGNMRFLGRKDHQVKIRGYRVELGEIESQLSGFPGIREALVIDRKDGNGNKYICAYYMLERPGEKIEKEELIAYLGGELPEYMIPSYFIKIERAPVTPNGKLDRNALPEPEFKIEESYAAPEDELQEKLLEIWKEVLFGRDVEKVSIGIDDDFFELGGHSLNAAVVISKIHRVSNVRIPLAEMFNHPTVRELAEVIKKSSKDKYAGINEVEKKEYYCLSSAQKRLYVLQRMNPDSTAYNIPEIMPLPAASDLEKIENIFKRLIERHESLRTSFRMENDTPVQVVHDEVEFEIEGSGIRDQGAGVKEKRRGDPPWSPFIRPFDLSKAPLLRVGLVKNSDGGYLLLVDMHHIISDGISYEILVKEYHALYKKEELAPLRVQYKDFSEWQDGEKEKENLERQEEFWLKEFEGEPPVLDLPTDYPRPMTQSFEGNMVNFEISIGETQALNAVVLTGGSTLFMVLAALVNILLSKLSGQEEIIIGTPIAGRRHADLEKIIGMFVNTLSLRNYPGGERTFREFLGDVKEKMLMVFENQEYPFEELVDKLSLKRDLGRNPLFDIMFVLQNMNTGMAVQGKEIEYENIIRTAKFDLTITAVERGGSLFFSFQYCTKLFKKETIERFIIYFKKIASVIVKEQDIKISDIEIVSEEEKRQILFDFNDTEADYPKDKTIHQLFVEQASKTPDHIAVVGAGSQTCPITLSYNELNEHSDRLAGVLIEKGVLADNIIGIMIQRSVEMIIGIMGILKAGGAYLPIDPDYPRERIQYALEDSNVKILVGMEECQKEIIVNCQLLIVNCKLKNMRSPQAPLHHSSFIIHHSNLAYIIYTSGSTGTPKGVAVEHRNVVNTLLCRKEEYKIDSEAIALQLFSFAFDGFVTSFFTPIISGSKVILLSGSDVKDIIKIKRAIVIQKITHFICIPSLYRAIINHSDSEELMSLKVVTLAGEKVLPGIVEQTRLKNKNTEVAVEYGVTEVSVMSTISRRLENEEIITIGKPIRNTSIYILDKYMKLQVVGVPGELCISGVGLARGYLNRPELTAKKFKFNRSYRSYEPYILYKTGDLARWLSDGNIEFLGRIDHQVKIRGFRIELGEIENRLIKHKDISQTVLVVKEDGKGDKSLTAYFVSTGESLEIELKEYLQKSLPDYMIPSYFVRLEKIPLTPSGKIDRRALPTPETKVNDEYVAPGNEIEKTLVGIWAEVLGRNEELIGIRDNFFQLGGHSLKATILVSKIRKVLDVIVPLAEIFKTPTIKKLAKYIKENNKDIYMPIEPAEEKEYYKLSPAQKRLYILQQLAMDNTGYNMPIVIPFEKSVAKEKLESALKRMIERHESLRTSFITVNEEPFQKIQREVDFAVGYYEIKEEAELIPLIAGFTKPFNLEEAPLLRVNLIDVGSSRRVLFIDMHHIITDGTSQGILEKEFRASLEGETPQPPRLQYKDYSEWYNRELRRGAVKEQEAYWLKEFSAGPPVLDIATDYPRPEMQSIEGNVVSFSFNSQETTVLKTIAKENETTLYMVLLAIFNILLAKLGGQEDIIVGTPIAARRHADLQDVVGMLVNTLAMRNYPCGDKTFREFLKDVGLRTLGAYENQEYPFEVLVDKIITNRDTSRNPVFDVMFNLLNQGDYKDAAAEQNERDSYRHKKATSKFDMNLTAEEIGARIFFTLEYSTRLFKPGRIDRVIGYYKNILKVLSRDTGLKIAEIEIMDEKEKEEVLRLASGVEWSYEGLETIHGLFEEQVKRTPDNIALVGATAVETLRATSLQISPTYLQITYRQLNDQSDRLAGLLIKKGVLTDTIVGIMMERSVEMIIGILGILKAGGAYLPIDSEYPGERKRYMLEDGGVRWLLVSDEIKDIGNEISNQLEIINLGREAMGARRNVRLEYTGSASNLVYVIYTSGSTGKPKGVMLEHRNLVNLIRCQYKYTNIDFDRVLQFTTISFDVSAQEIFSVFLSGGQLYLVNKETRTDIPALFKFIERNGIKTVFLPVSFLKMVFKEGAYLNLIPHCIGHITAAGEQLVINDNFKKYLRERKVYLHNHYGPSETHVVTTLTIDPEGNISEFPSIGKPVMNTGIYIVDRWGKLSPLGVVGEIRIGGAQVGRGYLNRPELTAEKFIFFPNFLTSSLPRFPLYRTGDLARFLADGNVEFLGRVDTQVKIRGFRIELGEIENELSKHVDIEDVVVAARESEKGSNYLCAYMVCRDEPGLSELREYLGRRLPDYMIPSYFVHVDRIPLTPNGKIDKKALPAPEIKTGKDYIAPRGKVEVKLAGIWSEILGIEKDKISIHDNFFQLGGHSLRATVLTSKLRKELNVKVPLAEVFKSPTIRELARYIRAASKESCIAVEPVEKKEYYPLSSAQMRFYILQEVTLESTAYNMTAVYEMDGFVDKEKFEISLRMLINRHAILRTSFQTINGKPFQRVHDNIEFKIEYDNLAAGGTGDAGGKIHHFIRAFDLSKAPLLRLSLVEISQNRHLLMFDMHHIISDGTSMTIFLTEFMAFYSGAGLPSPALQYKDFAQWQHDQLTTGKLKKQQEYWLKRFPGEPPVLNMPTDFPRPAVQSFEGDRFHFKLEKPLTGVLKNIIKETGTTLYMVLLTVYNILLARYTGQEDIVIGTTIAGRYNQDLQGIMGLLIETLVQRNYPMGRLEFKTFMEMVKKETLETHENQAFPFREIIRLVGADNEFSRNPVFDAMLIVHNFEPAEFQLEGLKFSPYRPIEGDLHRTSKVDFTIEAVDMADSEEILFTLEYCTRLYKRGTMERFARHFLNIIGGAAANPAVRLADIELMDEAERKLLLETFNDTSYKSGVEIPRLAPDRFRDQVAKTPDRIAIIGLGQVVNDMVFLTYRGLNESAGGLANELIAKGVQPETIVAIMMESSVEMAVGIWGILKAGGAYLPIEPGTPTERIDYMIKDSGAKLLVTTNDKEGEKVRSRDGEKVLLNYLSFHHSSFIIHHSNHLAYIIYTSGTSGHPKGVMVEHRNLANYIVAVADEIGLRPDDTVLQQGSLVFDAFVEEFYPLLVIGGKVAIPGKMLTRDIPALCQFIARHRVSMIASAPQMVNQLNGALRDGLPAPLNARELLASMRIVLVGGDVVKADYIDKFMETAEVYNTYGPTESTVCATYYKCSGLPGLSGEVPIGKPLADYKIYIGDKYGNPAPIGVGGELCVGGPGVTRGYMNQPGLTAEKFKKYRSYRSYKTYINYKTGDLARWLSDGNIEFLGRIDRQVKIRGYRIELAEIENRLTTLDNIKEAVVIDETRKSGDKYLAAYVVCTGTFDAGEIKSRLVRQLPDYMIPTHIIKVEQIPWTGIGKVDRKRLPRPHAAADSRQSFIAPGSETEKRLARIWQQILEKERVGIDDNFFDLGGTSLDIMKLNTRVKEEFDKHIPMVSLFKYTTIRALSRLLDEETGNKEPISQERRKEMEILEAIKKGQAKFKGRSQPRDEAGRTGFEIAVIGMSGIFPGARDLHEFWENLKNGVESIHFFSDKELLEDGEDSAAMANPNYIGARGIIEGIEYFDASFFGCTPLEARIMDPQVRIFQQTVWHALEDAGCDPFAYNRRIGLYAGASPSFYWAGLALFSNMNRGVSGFMTAQLADKDFMCTHTSYKLNLKGPSVSLQTACSTSLVAIHYAVQGLQHGECEMALAGGVSIAFPNKRGYIYQPGMIFSSDGHNRSFDARADGSIFGDGVGVVVLKPLADAIDDRDHIYAIIKGSAINNDGLRKVGYTAPGIQGQVEVIRAAQSMAEVEPGSITYIEAHGTATPLGDTVEIEALKQAFHTDKKRYCAVGALKSNIGHLYSAAGAAGFIKTVLALNHRLIPPSLHFQNPNPQIDFQNSPFYVNTTLKEWNNEQYPLRAGVSSFGIGGTNAHVVLEEWHEKRGSREEREVREERKLKLLLLSARTPSALNKMTENLVHYLQENPAVDLADVAYTLQKGRKHFPYRRMMVSADPEPGRDAGLLAQMAQRAPIVQTKEENRPIIFMFCGQGSQYAGMGSDLYRTEPVFRQELDRCFEILNPLAGYDVKEILYPSLENNRSYGSYRTYTIDQTEVAQPVLFAFEYALAKLLMAWGIRPTAMIGYSFGEYVAACLAGVFSPAQALEMIVTRGQLIRQTPAGKMTSVTLPERDLKPLLTGGLSIAIVNGPTCIVSGKKEDVEAFENEMKQKRLICVPLNMSHAVHSAVMNPIRRAFEQKISGFPLNKPQIPFISNVTARWVTGGEVTTSGYWGEHLCSTVRFSEGLTELLKWENAIFVEIGPGRILGMMVRVHGGKKPGHLIFNTVKHPQESAADDYFLLEKLGQFWQQGQVIDWAGFYGEEKRNRVSLPGYPFEGKRYWIDQNDMAFSGGMPLSAQAPGAARVGREISEDGLPTGDETAAPRNEVEQLIARWWKELMGLDGVGIHDDFFQLNGSSLVATQIIARLMQEYDIEIPMNGFYEQPTIAHLAEIIKGLQENEGG